MSGYFNREPNGSVGLTERRGGVRFLLSLNEAVRGMRMFLALSVLGGAVGAGRAFFCGVPSAWSYADFVIASSAVDLIALVCVLARKNIFAFFRFKAFACAGFFAYAAYSLGTQDCVIWLAASAWGVAGMLTYGFPLRLAACMLLLFWLYASLFA